MVTRHERIAVHNGRIALAARTHPTAGAPSAISFLCECDDETCTEHVALRLEDYDGLRESDLHLVVPGHPFLSEELRRSGAL
ncbi:MAG TPA: hypothetical protein VHC67_04705 [Gaiellaceae bacterium]|jgi:hypothetical protein|nr:hypothetical protein [Gaiellaceae bacterium]